MAAAQQAKGSPINSEQRHAAWVDVIAGGFGGALAKSLLSPFQRIVVLQQLGQHTGLGVGGLARYIYQHEGPKGFWRGNLTSMLIRVPYSGVQFVLYAKMKFFLQDWLDRKRVERVARCGESLADTRGVETMEKFILKCGAGGVSAAIAGAAVYPGEVVRLRLMSGEKQFHGIVNTCRLIFQETHSMRNFYRGLGASLMQKVPDILVSFATYETVKYSLLDSPDPILFRDNRNARNVLATIVGGALAALASIAVSFPLDVAKRRIGMSGTGKDKVMYTSVGDCLRKIYQREGIRGWYAGSAMEMVRCVPQVVLMWFFIEGIQCSLSGALRGPTPHSGSDGAVGQTEGESR